MVAYHAHADEGAAVSDVVLQLIERSCHLPPVAGEFRLEGLGLVPDGRMDHVGQSRLYLLHLSD